MMQNAAQAFDTPAAPDQVQVVRTCFASLGAARTLRPMCG